MSPRRRQERNPFDPAHALRPELLPTTQAHYLGQTERGAIWLGLWLEAHKDSAYDNLHALLLQWSFEYVKGRYPAATMEEPDKLDLTSAYELGFWLTRADCSLEWIQTCLSDAVFWGERYVYLLGTPGHNELLGTVAAGRKLALRDNNLTRQSWDTPDSNSNVSEDGLS